MKAILEKSERDSGLSKMTRSGKVAARKAFLFVFETGGEAKELQRFLKLTFLPEDIRLDGKGSCIDGTKAQ